jgi:hypothetical protein
MALLLLLFLDSDCLQTNSFNLQAATSVQSLLDSSDLSLPSHAWFHALHCALALLDLRQHWPRLVVSEIQEEADRAPAQVPRFITTYPGASPHAHLRHTWSVMVEAASRLQTELAFQSWLDKTVHRAFSYKSETLAGLLSRPVYHKASYWSKLSLPWKTQQYLLTRRSLGLDIATHWPSRWRRSGHDVFGMGEPVSCFYTATPVSPVTQQKNYVSRAVPRLSLVAQCPNLSETSATVTIASSTLL